MTDNYIIRGLTKRFIEGMEPNKVMLILGARRVGKTSFIKHLIQSHKLQPLLLNGEDLSTQRLLAERTIDHYKKITTNHKLIIIDEAQKIPDIGLALKLMVDEIEGIQIIVTGSSTFDLTNQLGEPLTGRKKTYYMYPLAQCEYMKHETIVETQSRLNDRIVFGNYPELTKRKTDDDKIEYLNEVVSSYLLKDILEIDGIRNSSKMYDLLRLIAFQTGNEVSIEELGKQLGMGKNTVANYLDLLANVFVLFKVQGFSRNLRSEITKTNKWYFYDTGIRNALISNFNPMSLRNDAGFLWENFIIAERLKWQHYSKMYGQYYFWRTYQQQEIDWIEERAGQLHAFEFKWNSLKKVKPPSAWIKNYPDATYTVITPENYLNWIS